MQRDHLTYKRAGSTSLFGLLVQVTVALTLLIYGVRSGDHAAVSGAIFAAVGVLAWTLLLILFDQHRRERLEAMEAEALAEEASSSVFEDSGQTLRVAGRRLEFVRKYVITGGGLVMGLMLVGSGLTRLSQAQARLAAPAADYAAPPEPTVGLFVGIIVGVLGFIFARYAAGMAKRADWSALRAGAGFAVGSSLAGVGMLVASFVLINESVAVQRLMELAVPLGMIIVGGEFFLNFLLDLYRPRKAGDVDRPVFDSRVLAFVAAPDRVAQSISEAINYQLGFNVSGGWLYQLLSRSAQYLLAFAGIVVWLLSGLVVIEPHQRAMILRFGAVHAADVGPGLHFKAPWPIDTVVIPEFVETDADGEVVRRVRTATGIRRLDLGTTRPTEGNEPILWTEAHAEGETFTLTQPAGGSAAVGATDFALVAVEVPLEYAIEDVSLYERLGPPGQRDELLEAIGRREVTRYIAGLSIDEVLATRRTEMAASMRQRIEAAFARLNPDETGEPMGSGVRVLFVGAEGVHPPLDTAAAFENVVAAQQNRSGMILSAEAAAIEILTRVVGSVELADEVTAAIDAYNRLRRSGADEAEIIAQEQRVEALLADAGGAAAQRLAASRAVRWARHMRARSRAQEFAGQSVAYLAEPSVYRRNAMLNAVAAGIRESSLILIPSRTPLQADVNLQDEGAQLDPFDPEAVPEP